MDGPEGASTNKALSHPDQAFRSFGDYKLKLQEDSME
jgi:hypothetical protein